MVEEVEKTDEELELETLEVENDLVEPKPEAVKPSLDPEHFASRQRAHDLKVANFLSGGKF